ncbi:MAG: 3'-5' exonuclease, partial [Bacteroidota bacterium]
PMETVLKKFSALIDESEYLVAHNMNLAANVVEAEFIRKGISSRLMASEQFSLMQEATYFCKILAKGGTKYKWPSLQEIHMKCYNSHFADAHEAKVNVQALANCFFYLVKKEEIDLF